MNIIEINMYTSFCFFDNKNCNVRAAAVSVAEKLADCDVTTATADKMSLLCLIFRLTFAFPIINVVTYK